MSGKLRECPFCGNSPRIKNGLNSEDKPFYQVTHDCMNLLSQIKTFCCETEPEAIAAWNRRTQPENEALTCKDCVYWKDRQVQLRDGSCRDYLPNEPWSVTADVGINVGSHCTLHGFDNESGSWFWAKAEDFCSRGIRKPERSEG